MKAKGSPGTIQHEGTVQKVEKDSIEVRISSVPACAGCHAESYCSLSGREEKIINISGRFNVAAGENVTVVMHESMGFKAVIISYLLPLIIMVLLLIVLNSFGINELAAGIISIAALGPYYLILYLFRNRISKSFKFSIKDN